MSNMEARISLQRSRFSLIQEAADFDETDFSITSRQQTLTLLEVLEDNWKRFKEEHESICFSEIDGLSETPYFREKIYERCQAFYVFSRAKLQTHRVEFDSLEPQYGTTHSENGSAVPLKPNYTLPRLKMPSFSGNYQEWKSFYDLFTSLVINNADLTNVEKMHYLKTSVTGEALRLVCNLPASGENFNVAWSLLVSRYENERLLITTHLDRIMNMKPLKTKSASGLRTLLTTISESMGAIRAIGTPVHQGELLLVHILIRLLDPETREAWELKTSSYSHYPTYAQFEEFLANRTRAMENVNLNTLTFSSQRKYPSGSSGNTNPKITAHVATSSDSSTYTCPLCGSAHHMARCYIYIRKNLQQKKAIIMQLRRCYNCLGPHTIKKCDSTKRCFKCGKKHHTSTHDYNFKHAFKQKIGAQNREETAKSTEQPQFQITTQ